MGIPCSPRGWGHSSQWPWPLHSRCGNSQSWSRALSSAEGEMSSQTSILGVWENSNRIIVQTLRSCFYKTTSELSFGYYSVYSKPAGLQTGSERKQNIGAACAALALSVRHAARSVTFCCASMADGNDSVVC